MSEQDQIPYEYKISIMIRYLMLKVQERDWHGASDAANDLREMEAAQKGREEQRTRDADQNSK